MENKGERIKFKFIENRTRERNWIKVEREWDWRIKEKL
jgi:hypothetical protein